MGIERQPNVGTIRDAEISERTGDFDYSDKIRTQGQPIRPAGSLNMRGLGGKRFKPRRVLKRS